MRGTHVPQYPMIPPPFDPKDTLTFTLIVLFSSSCSTYGARDIAYWFTIVVGIGWRSGKDDKVLEGSSLLFEGESTRVRVCVWVLASQSSLRGFARLITTSTAGCRHGPGGRNESAELELQWHRHVLRKTIQYSTASSASS
jgi:hypothetical protein